MYQVVFSESVVKELKKLDKQTARVIKNWIARNLQGVVDPRLQGKPLKGKLHGIWRYRIGEYRLFAEIQDDRLIILLIKIGHRREVYR